MSTISNFSNKRPRSVVLAQGREPHPTRQVRFKSQTSALDQDVEAFFSQGLASGVGRQANGGENLQRGGRERDIQDSEGEEEGLQPGVKVKKVLAIHAPYAPNLAAAYYDPELRKMFVLEDTKDTSAWDLACLVVEQVKPDFIIMSTKTPDSLIDKIDAYCEENQSTHRLLQPFKTFSIGPATHQMASIRLTDMVTIIESPNTASSDTASEEERRLDEEVFAKYGYGDDEGAGMGKLRLNLVKLGCWVNVDAPLAVAATGGLLAYLLKQHDGGGLVKENGRVELTGIESMALQQHMLINQDALQSLAIYDTEPHGFIYSKQQKQGFSIFGLLNETLTPMGRKLLHTWHLRPLLDIREIEARHEAVGMFSYIDNRYKAQQLRDSLKGIHNVTQACTRIRRGSGGPKDWRDLIEALSALDSIHYTLLDLAHGARLSIVRKVKRVMTEDLLSLMSDIAAIIDWDESKEQNRVIVRIGVDEELDGWREKIAGLKGLLSGVAKMIQPLVPAGFCDTISVVSFPQLGFLVACKPHDPEAKFPEWEARFEGEQMHYFKTPQMKNLDEHFGDIDSAIIDRQLEIVQQLVERLRDVEKPVLDSMEVVAELDCLLSLAKVATDYRLVRPIMDEDPILMIHNGRHLLHELCVEQYITNDTMLNGGGEDAEYSSMMIVTGANGSGKSAYGKQVAIIVFMAQIGSFVPAENARIGLCDKIYTRLQTKESVSKAASAFMIDLSQVSLALRGATSRSLIVLDEFGKGTTPADGAGLLTAVIEHLLEGPRPRAIVMTHFHELFAHQILPPSLNICFCHMKTEFQEQDKSLTYIYKLCPNLALSSSAAECALLHGVPRDIVDRGRQVTEALATFELSKLFEEELDPDEVAELQDAEDLCKRFLAWEVDPDGVEVMSTLREILEYGNEEREARRRASEARRQHQRSADDTATIEILSDDEESE